MNFVVTNKSIPDKQFPMKCECTMMIQTDAGLAPVPSITDLKCERSCFPDAAESYIKVIDNYINELTTFREKILRSSHLYTDTISI